MIALLAGAIRLALGAIVRNKTRAGLTVLGILIGITAVVIVTALGESTSQQIGGEIDSFAANALFVWPQPVQASGAKSKVVGRLTEADGRAIAREAVSVSAVAPSTGLQVRPPLTETEPGSSEPANRLPLEPNWACTPG